MSYFFIERGKLKTKLAYYEYPHRLSFGIKGIGYTGAERLFHSSMSLQVEYVASIRVNHSRFKRMTVSENSESVNNFNTTIFSFGGEGVRFGLSVYF